MTGDVLAHGEDDGAPRSRRGVAVGVAAVLLLVAIGVVARRHQPAPQARPTPTPAPSTPAPPIATTDRFAFAGTVVRRPADRAVLGVTLAAGTPAFVVSVPPNVYAFTAAGGPEHAEVLVGWCPAARLFQDATGTYRYGADGVPYGAGPALPQHRIERDAGGDPARVRVSDDEARFAQPRTGGTGTGPPACPAAGLVWPPLPPAASTIEGAARAFRRVTGRYLVTPESFAFCPGPPRGADCRAGGWEIYNVPSLPPEDLASEYVWEGGYAILAKGSDGTFRALRLPDAKLVRRAHLGVRAVGGVPESARTSGGAFLLRFVEYGLPGPGVRPPSPARDYAVRADAELFLGRGYTGLGQPHATLATLRRFLHDNDGALPSMWLILDARGRVQRITIDATGRI